MSGEGSRVIRKSSVRASQDLRDLIQGVLVAELLNPSKEFWLISPWVSDVAVIDNSDGSFSGLDPSWPSRELGLAEVLARLTRVGTEVRVDVRPIDHNKVFLDRLDHAATPGRLKVRVSPVLHEKGMLADGFVISGSMNFTQNGLNLLDEVVRLDVAPDTVAQARLDFLARWNS